MKDSTGQTTYEAQDWPTFWKALALIEEEYDQTVTLAENQYEQAKNQAHKKYKKVYDAALKQYQETAQGASADTVRVAFATYRNTSEAAWKVYARVAYGDPLLSYRQTEARALNQLREAKALLNQLFFATGATAEAVTDRVADHRENRL